MKKILIALSLAGYICVANANDCMIKSKCWNTFVDAGKQCLTQCQKQKYTASSVMELIKTATNIKDYPCLCSNSMIVKIPISS